jgi:hypothetical protein
LNPRSGSKNTNQSFSEAILNMQNSNYEISFENTEVNSQGIADDCGL